MLCHTEKYIKSFQNIYSLDTAFLILETKLLTFHVNTLKTPTTATRQDFGEKIKWETLVQLLKQSLYSEKSGY